MMTATVERFLLERWTVMDELRARGWEPGDEDDPVRVSTVHGPMTEAEHLERYGTWEPRVWDRERGYSIGACPICRRIAPIHFTVWDGGERWSAHWCTGEMVHGDVLTLIERLDGCGREKAAALVAERLTSAA